MFGKDEHPAFEFKDYLTKKIESTLTKYREKRLKHLEEKIMSQYPDYVPLKNLEDTNTFSIPDEGLGTSKQLTEED